MIGALFGVIAAFSWGAGDFLGGLASRRLPTFLVVAASQTAKLAILIPTALIIGGAPPSGAVIPTRRSPELWAARAYSCSITGLHMGESLWSLVSLVHFLHSFPFG